MQIPRPGTTIARRVGANRPTLSPTSAAIGRARIPARDAAKIRHLAGYHRPPRRSIMRTTEMVMHSTIHTTDEMIVHAEAGMNGSVDRLAKLLA